jgi:hypothetical protein
MRRGWMVVSAVVLALVMALGLGARHAAAQPAPPTANAGGPYTGTVGVPIQFAGGDSTGFNLSFTWDFGDGTTATGVVVTHTYTAPGTYTVVLTVVDRFGQQASDRTTATISPAAPQQACVLTAVGVVCTPTVWSLVPGPVCVQTITGIVCSATPFLNPLLGGTPCVLTTSGVVCGTATIGTPAVGTAFCTQTPFGVACAPGVIGTPLPVRVGLPCVLTPFGVLCRVSP